MNDNLNLLKTKTEDVLQQFFAYLNESDQTKEILQLHEKIDVLINHTQEIIRQNSEIIALNNEILKNQSNMQIKDNIVKEQSNNVTEEPNRIMSHMEISQQTENEIIKKETKEPQPTVEKNVENKISIEEQVRKYQQEIEEYQRQKEKQKHENTIEEVKEEIRHDNTPKQNTSSVLEFLHKRVIKDNSIEQAEENQSENTQKVSNIRNLTEQIKQDAKEFSSQKPRSIAEQFEDKANKDLLSAIGVSEKFMFINDLFSGNIKEYTSFVNSLNESNDLQNSLEIIQQMQSQKKWAKTSLAYTTLENIITKRFE